MDSWFDDKRGVICLIQVLRGCLSEGARITTSSAKKYREIDDRTDFGVQEIGFLTPEAVRTGVIKVGQVGYIVTGLIPMIHPPQSRCSLWSGMRSTKQARGGDAIFTPSVDDLSTDDLVMPLEEIKPMLFASIFPVESTDLDHLFAAVDRLCLNDSSITVSKEHSLSLGTGTCILTVHNNR